MKKYYIILSCFLLIVCYSCQRDHQTDFKAFLGDKEIRYTGAVGSVVTQPGNLRVGLKWPSSSDPGITKYVIYYNNKADSQVVNLTNKTDSIRTVIQGLSEYTYSFTIYTFDAKGNKSVPTVVNNVKVYGPVYKSTLLNRGYNGQNPYSITSAGVLTLNFITPDTINTGTTIKYTSKTGESKSVILGPSSSSIIINDYKPATQVTYNSSYIPQKNAIDVFTAPIIDTFPPIIHIEPCDKSLFKGVKLPYDFEPYESVTDLYQLWDGDTSPKGFPNVFHSNGQVLLPGTLTIDLGKVYTRLTQVEEIGRNCCANPNDFEIWGIADITNAATTIAPNDPAWKAEAIQKGWKLLKEVKRTDDGSAPLKSDLDPNVPPVRYLRIRVISSANGDLKTANISQITPFYEVLE
jgi:hypothetical protein